MHALGRAAVASRPALASPDLTRKEVLVYSGEGASEKCVVHTLRALMDNISHAYKVARTDAERLARGSWEPSTALLIFPGGRATPWVKALHPIGTGRIRKYVEQGGRYLGFGAGAYFAAAIIEFEVGRPGYEIVSDRELKLFGGVASGSVYPGYTYGSEAGARTAALVTAEGEPLRAYHNGGCCFKIPPEHRASTQVLAWYEQEPDVPMLRAGLAPAVVCSAFGAGTAVLSGAHLECSPEDLEELASLEEKATVLKIAVSATDHIRCSLLRRILGDALKLHLQTKSTS